jgi:hypothetical protein
MTTTPPTLRSITVKYQLDPEYPVMSASIKYQVLDDETEIVFPTGDRRTFKNWDVRGVRQNYFCEEIAPLHTVGEGASNTRSKELIEHGIRPCDVQKFVASLAQNIRYEAFFDMKFDVVETAPPPPAPSPISVKKVLTKKQKRRFPYLECARLWNEGKTQREIAEALGYLDESKEGNAQTHALRTFITKMHDPGYFDPNRGELVQLPYRVKKAAA